LTFVIPRKQFIENVESARHQDREGHELRGCGKTPNARVSVEERPFQGRVKCIELMRASAPVVVLERVNGVFRSRFTRAARTPTNAPRFSA